MKIVKGKIIALSILCILSITTKAQNNKDKKIRDSVITKLPLSDNTFDFFKRSSSTNKTLSPEFIITSYGFSNTQDPNRSFIVFQFAGRKAVDLKSSIISKLTTMFSSPKDVINNISDNIVSIDGYAKNVFYYKGYRCDIQFNMTIEFKDGKIRYNNPIIKQIYVDSDIIGMLRIDKSKTFLTITEAKGESFVANFFNTIVSDLNNAAKKSDDW